MSFIPVGKPFNNSIVARCWASRNFPQVKGQNEVLPRFFCDNPDGKEAFKHFGLSPLKDLSVEAMLLIFVDTLIRYQRWVKTRLNQRQRKTFWKHVVSLRSPFQTDARWMHSVGFCYKLRATHNLVDGDNKNWYSWVNVYTKGYLEYEIRAHQLIKWLEEANAIKAAGKLLICQDIGIQLQTELKWLNFTLMHLVLMSASTAWNIEGDWEYNNLRS